MLAVASMTLPAVSVAEASCSRKNGLQRLEETPARDSIVYFPAGKGKDSLPHILLHTRSGDRVIYVLGYDNAARTAKLAYAENISLKDACVRLGYLTPERFDEVFHPEDMA